MNSLATTRLSSKGQVVIPEEVRDQLGLLEGTQFVVIGQRDIVILKVVTPPSMSNFSGLIKEVRKEARKSGLQKKDIKVAIKKARKS